MKEIQDTKLWAEFLEWLGGDHKEIEFLRISLHEKPLVMFAQDVGRKHKETYVQPIGALIGLLEQFLEYNGIYLHQSVTIEDEVLEFTYTVSHFRTHIADEKLVVGCYETPQEAKSEAIFQYFKSKG